MKGKGSTHIKFYIFQWFSIAGVKMGNIEKEENDYDSKGVYRWESSERERKIRGMIATNEILKL